MVGQRAPGKHVKLARLARCIGTNIARAPSSLSARRSRCGGRNPAIRNGRKGGEANRIRRSPEGRPRALHLKSDFGGVKILPEVWAFRAAILELIRPDFLALCVGRICACIGQIIALIVLLYAGRTASRAFEKKCWRLLRAATYNNPAPACSERSSQRSLPVSLLSPTNRPPHRSRRLLRFHRGRLRSTVNPQMAMASQWNEHARDPSGATFGRLAMD